MPNTYASSIQYLTSALYGFQAELTDSISAIPSVQEISPTVKVGNTRVDFYEWSWDDWENYIASKPSETLFYFQLKTTQSSFELMVRIVWLWNYSQKSLGESYPNKNADLLPFLYQAQHYYIGLADCKSQSIIVSVDSSPHHVQSNFPTFPHHRHEKSMRRGKTQMKDPGEFVPTLNYLVNRLLYDYL